MEEIFKIIAIISGPWFFLFGVFASIVLVNRRRYKNFLIRAGYITPDEYCAEIIDERFERLYLETFLISLIFVSSMISSFYLKIINL
jgi:hypothetical protein